MLQVLRYTTPFSKPFETSHARFTKRRGLWISWLDDSGDRHWGEAAPLPHFSCETLDEVEDVLHRHQTSLAQLLKSNGDFEWWAEETESLSLPPALQFGFDTIAAGMEAAQSNRPLYRLLFEKAHPAPALNITFSMDKPDRLHQMVEEAVAQGWSTLKFKVGRHIKIEADLLESVRERHPEINIRIDANQAWKVNEAVRALHRFAPARPEYCEQPVHRDELDALKSVRENSPVPIAADEAVTSSARAHEILDMGAADVLILKPMLIGGLNETLAIIREAGGRNVPVVITSLFDTIIGRLTAAHLAAGTPGVDRAHGLATGDVLQYDLAPDDRWIRGTRFHLPEQPGIGLSLRVSDIQESFGGQVEQIL